MLIENAHQGLPAFSIPSRQWNDLCVGVRETHQPTLRQASYLLTKSPEESRLLGRKWTLLIL